MTELDEQNPHHAEEIPGQEIPISLEHKLHEQVQRMHVLIDNYEVNREDFGDDLLSVLDRANAIKLDMAHKPGFSAAHQVTRLGRKFKVGSEKIKRGIVG